MTGGADIKWYLFSNEVFIEEHGYEDKHKLFLDMLYRNDFGFQRIPEVGEIMYMKPLGEYLLIYGTKGIAYTTFIIDPIPALAIINIWPIQVNRSECIAGSNTKHMFMDNIGGLWLITSEGRKYLDFSYLFNPANVNYEIEYSEFLDEFYINSTRGTYVYNRGMSSVQENILAVTSINNKVVYLKKEIYHE